jgi:hypothetical protein
MHRFFPFWSAVLLFVSPLPAGAQSQGPDVIVSGFYSGVDSWGSVGGVAAFSIGARCCNIGNQNLSWVTTTNQHPVIGQNLYRVKDGVFEQIGLSWLKHGYSAVNQSAGACGPCQNPGTNQLLGPGCSDPYNAAQNGSQNRLGPRSDVNPVTGAFPYPPTSPPYGSVVDRRLQVAHADLDPAQNLGARYFGEVQYITPNDAAAGNANNNAAWKECLVSPNGGSYIVTDTGADNPQSSAIYAWQAVSTGVTIDVLDIPADGRFHIGHRAISLGGGMTRYVYAVHNYNSDKGAGSLAIDLPAGVTVQGATFHDVAHHSGEPYNDVDWTFSVTPTGVRWDITETFAQNPNANAIRWGTCYTFTFESTAAPTGYELGLFKPACGTSGGAQLTLLGNGRAWSFTGLLLDSTPSSGIILGGDTSPGPISLGTLGVLNLGFSPAFFTLADFTGVLGPLTGNDFTDTCGQWALGIQLGGVGVPTGLVIHTQAIVVDPLAPNGAFHISNPVTLTVQ